MIGINFIFIIFTFYYILLGVDIACKIESDCSRGRSNSDSEFIDLFIPHLHIPNVCDHIQLVTLPIFYMSIKYYNVYPRYKFKISKLLIF